MMPLAAAALSLVLWAGPSARPDSSTATTVDSSFFDLPDTIPAPSGKSRGVKVEYDKFKDQTVVRAELLLPPKGDALGGQIWLTYLYAGEKPEPPAGVVLSFHGWGEDPVWRLRCRSFIALVDGHRVSLGEGDYTAYPEDRLSYYLPWTTFLRLANAKMVEGQVCNTEFTIKGYDLSVLREFASRARARATR